MHTLRRTRIDSKRLLCKRRVSVANRNRTQQRGCERPWDGNEMNQTDFMAGLNDILRRFKRQNPPIKSEIEQAVNEYLERSRSQSETIDRLLGNNDTVEVYLLGNEFSVYLPVDLADWISTKSE